MFIGKQLSLKNLLAFSILAVFCLLPLTSCVTGDVKLVPSKSSDTIGTRTFYEAGQFGLAQNTINLLSSHLWLDEFSENTPALLNNLEKLYEQERTPEILSVLADIAVCKAKSMNNDDLAMGFYLSGAQYAYEYLKLDPPQQQQAYLDMTPARSFVAVHYNTAVAHVFSYLNSRKLLREDAFQFMDATGKKIRFSKLKYRMPLLLDHFTKFLLCDDFKVKNLNFYSFKFGIGVPIISVLSQSASQNSPLPFRPNSALATTAILHFEPHPDDDGARIAHMEFLWADRDDTVLIGNMMLPLCQDFSTPLAFQSDNPTELSLSATFNPDKAASKEGLFLTEPFSPRKIPVVFVHGLMSSPGTWIQMFNTLRYDPVIRDKFQFWFYAYSTGTPIMISASKFRAKLKYAHQAFAEKYPRAIPNLNNMVIVGHSMGGLLTKTTILESQDLFLKILLGEKHQDILAAMAPDDAESLRNFYCFSKLPYIKRVVFLATPHRGSSLASLWITRMAARLISLPVDVIKLGVSAVQAINIFSDKKIQRFQFATGLDNLSPGDAFLKQLSALPFPADIPYHSIIGNWRNAGIPSGSDSVVNYQSSHLDGAASELIVKHGHSIQENPLTTLEIRRILLLHLKNTIPNTIPSSSDVK